MDKRFQGKKLMVIGGAFQHCKVVEAAKEMGITVYVTDFLKPEEAPAKQIADKWYMHNITDVDAIVETCKEEEIDGVMMLCLDACQKPYQQICEKGGYPCFGTKEQFHVLTDKNAFKAFCKEHGVDTIPSYGVDDFDSIDNCEEKVLFPILIKPSISRGSRGQSVCYNYEEAVRAIEFAQSESANGEVVIEKYMKDCEDFTMSYLVINGDVYLVRTGDRFLGSAEEKLDKLCIAGISPSKHNRFYMDKVNARVVKFIKELGIQNGPVFMQGFVDGDTVRFYDPGLRFPGIEYERMYDAIYGINIIKALIEYAITGCISDEYTRIDHDAGLGGKLALDLLIAVKPGTIVNIEGAEAVRNHPNVISMFCKYGVGDTVGEHHNVNQRFCEIDVVCDDIDSLIGTVNWIYETLKVEDAAGNNLLFGKIDWISFKKRYGLIEE